MKKEFLEPEVEVVEFEVAEVEGIATSADVDPENPVNPNPDWGWGE